MPHPNLPLMNPQEKNQLFNPSQYLTRFSYLYDASRPQRHMTARTYILGLYHVGALLINKGLAYQPNALLIQNDKIDINSKEVSNGETREKLLEFYNSIESVSLSKGSAHSQNPLHALFVIKVALDHLPSEAIVTSAKNLINEAVLMTFYPVNIRFPNGSSFVDDHAAAAVLANYIYNNPHRFANLNTKSIRQSINDNDIVVSPYSYLGTLPRFASLENQQAAALLSLEFNKIIALKNDEEKQRDNLNYRLSNGN